MSGCITFPAEAHRMPFNKNAEATAITGHSSEVVNKAVAKVSSEEPVKKLLEPVKESDKSV